MKGLVAQSCFCSFVKSPCLHTKDLSLHRKRKRITDEQRLVQHLLSTVLRFDLTTYKLGKTSFTRTDLAGLKDCSSLLIYEMGMECVATGLDVTVEVRLSSFSVEDFRLSPDSVP